MNPVCNTQEASLPLTGVPETMLWTLHNRAREAMRPDAWLRDEEAVRIYRALDYDFERSFGTPDGSHAIRSVMFDEAVRAWLARHPQGWVVELAAGLETQFSRVDNGSVNWLCVDLPEALAVRERFLPAQPRCRHVALSALDLRWMDELPADQPVFISMQGLLMYFPQAEVQRLLVAMVQRFAGGVLMFDTIPRWFSRKTLTGFQKTPHYRAPPMPWGVGRHEIDALLRSWTPHIARISDEPYRRLRTFPWGVASWLGRLPWLGRHLPTVVRVEVAQHFGG